MSDINLEELEKEFNIAAGINLDELKNAFEEENKKEGNYDSKFVRIPYGETIVRILPPWTKDSVKFYKHFLSHRIGNKSYTCLRSRKYEPVKVCPICQITKELYTRGSEEDKTLGGLIRARDKYYYNVVVRQVKPNNKEKAEKEGYILDYGKTKVKILSTGVKLFEKIKKYFFLEDYGDMTNILKGYDFVIVKDTIKTASGYYMPNYDNSYPKKNSSPLAESTEEIKEILGNMYNLDEIVSNSQKTRDEIVNELTEYAETESNEYLYDIIKSVLKKGQHLSHKESIVLSKDIKNYEGDNNNELKPSLPTDNEIDVAKDDDDIPFDEKSSGSEDEEMSLDEFEKELLG